MIVRCQNPAAWCRTYQAVEEGYRVPDADRPAGDVFASEPIDLDCLTVQAEALWRQHQKRRYG